MKKYALAIGASTLEYLNILFTYYPNDICEQFDVFFFFDSRKVTELQIKEIAKKYGHKVFTEANYIDLSELYLKYEREYGLVGKSKKMMYEHGCIFKILQPMYLIDELGYEKVLSSDDDIFILGDITKTFENYKEFAFKKEQLFYLRTSTKYDTLREYNKIFNLDISLEQANSISVNAGNILSSADTDLHKHFYNFITNDYVHHLYYDFEGYTRWTIEQRFQQFNVHNHLKNGRSIEFFKAEDLRLVLSVDKDPQEKYLKTAIPRLIHYAVGKKKPLFLNQFLSGIEWKYGFKYEPKYELKNKLFVEKPVNKLF